MTTDRIILARRIHTLDARDTVADAIAVRDGRVRAVGARDAVIAACPPGTPVDDLGDATVIPGFNDAHAHMEREGLKTFRPSLAGARSVADILRVVAGVAAVAPKGEWIVTMPVGEPPHYFNPLDGIAEGRLPTREELDRAAPDHPVCIPGLFGNWGAPPGYTALNSRAIALNGLTAGTRPRVAGLDVARDATGAPTGLIVEHNRRPAVELDLLPAVPRFGYATRLEGLRRSIALYHAKGTTSVYEGHGLAADVIAAYRALWEAGDLTMRAGLVVSPSWADLAEAERAMRDWLGFARGRGFGDPMLRIGGIHVAFGGDPVTAALSRANLPDTGWAGFVEQAVSPADFEELAVMAARFDLRFHTIVSDRLAEVVPILQRVASRVPIAGRRWVVEHIGRSTPEDLQALKALGVGVTLIPMFYLWKGGHRYLDLPAAEADLIAPSRALLALGVPVSVGTDNIPYDPISIVWSMVARQERRTGRPVGPGGALTPSQALRLITTESAWLTFEEDVKGPLAPGFYADLAVLDRDPLDTPVDAMRGIACRATMVGGRWVHGTPGA